MDKTKLIDELVRDVTQAFRSFGGGQTSSHNPLVNVLKDAPPQFAAGVDIREVITFVLTRKEQIEQPGKN